MGKARWNPLPEPEDFIADGFRCGLEDDTTMYTAKKVAPGVFRIGAYLYSGRLKPLTKGAPKVDTYWDCETSNSGSLKAWHARNEGILFARSFTPFFGAKAKGDDSQLKFLNRDGYLRITCRKCQRSRLDGIGYLSRQGRLGDRTLSEFAAVARCGRWDCNGEQTVTVEGPLAR